MSKLSPELFEMWLIYASNGEPALTLAIILDLIGEDLPGHEQAMDLILAANPLGLEDGCAERAISDLYRRRTNLL